MRIVISGAGAMGSFFGGRLARAGHAVGLVDVDPERIAALNRYGVRERDGAGGEVQARVTAGRADAIAGDADLLILFTKANHSSAAVAAAAPLLRPGGVALTLQNGLGSDRVLADAFGPARVLVGMTTWPADAMPDGAVRVLGAGEIRLWSMDGEDRPALHHVAAALDGAGLACVADREVRVAIWEKVIFNAAMNGTAALTGMTVGGMGDFAPTRELIAGIVEEGAAIAAATGIAVRHQTIHATVGFALREHRGHKPSMLQDVEHGRPTEVEAIQGALVEAAVAASVPAPRLEVLATLLRAINCRQASGRR